MAEVPPGAFADWWKDADVILLVALIEMGDPDGLMLADTEYD